MRPNPEILSFAGALSSATNSHNFDRVVPFIDPEAVYYFSSGRVMRGIEEIRAGFESVWERIEGERYMVGNINCRFVLPKAALYVYQFNWEGMVKGEYESGEGRGIQLLRKREKEENWKIYRQRLTSI
jgi:ketosteroid isomerase-like protein